YQADSDSWALKTQIDNTFSEIGDDATGFASVVALLTETQVLVSEELGGDNMNGRVHLYTCDYTEGVYGCTHSMVVEAPAECTEECTIGATGFHTDPSDPSVVSINAQTQRGKNKFNMKSEMWTLDVYSIDAVSDTYSRVTVPNPEGGGYDVNAFGGMELSGGFMVTLLEDTSTGEPQYNALYHRASTMEWILDQKITEDICTADSPVSYCHGKFGRHMVLSPPDATTGLPTLALYTDSCSQSIDPSGCVVFLAATPIPDSDPETESAYTWGVVGGIQSLAPDGSSLGGSMQFPSPQTLLAGVYKGPDSIGVSIDASDVAQTVPSDCTTSPPSVEIGRYILDDLCLHFSNLGVDAYDPSATVTLAIPDLHTTLQCTPTDGSYLVDPLQLPLDALVETGGTFDMTATYYSGSGTQYYSSPAGVVAIDIQLPGEYGIASMARLSTTYLALPSGASHTLSSMLYNEYGALICDKRDVVIDTVGTTRDTYTPASYEDATCTYTQTLTVSEGDTVYVMTDSVSGVSWNPVFTQATPISFCSPADLTGVSVFPSVCQLYMPQVFDVTLTDSDGNKVGSDLADVYMRWADDAALVPIDPSSLTPLSWVEGGAVYSGTLTVQSEADTSLEVYTKDSASGAYTLVATETVDVAEPLAGLATVSGVPGHTLSGPMCSSAMQYNSGDAVSEQRLFSLDLDLLEVTSYAVRYFAERNDDHGYVTFDVLNTVPLWVEYTSSSTAQEEYSMAYDHTTAFLAVCRKSTIAGDSGVYIFSVDRDTGVMEKDVFLTIPSSTSLSGACAMRGGVLAVALFDGVYIYEVQDGLWHLQGDISVDTGNYYVYPDIDTDGVRVVYGVTAHELVYVYGKEDGVWTLTHTIANPFGEPDQYSGKFGAWVAVDGDLVAAVDNMPVKCHCKADRGHTGRTAGVFRVGDDGSSDFLDAVCYTDDAAYTGAGLGGSMQLREGTLVTTSLTLNTVYIHSLLADTDRLQHVRSLQYAPDSDVDPTHSTLGFYTAYDGEAVFVSSVYVLDDSDTLAADFHDTTIAVVYSGVRDDPYLGSISVDPAFLDCHTDSVTFTVTLYDASGTPLTSDLSGDIVVEWGGVVPDSVVYIPSDSTYACSYADTASATELPSSSSLTVHVTTGGGGLYALSQDDASVTITVDYGTPTSLVWVSPANAMFPGDARSHEDVPYYVKVPGRSGKASDYSVVQTTLSYYATPVSLQMTPSTAVLGQDMQVSVTTTDTCGLMIPADNGMSGAWYPTGGRTVAEFDPSTYAYTLDLEVGLDQLLYRPVIALDTLGTEYYEAVEVSMGTVTRVEIKPDHVTSGPHMTTLMITPYNEYDQVMEGDTSFEVTCVQGDMADGAVLLFADVCMTCSPVGYSVNIDGKLGTSDMPLTITVGSLTTPVSTIEVTLVYKGYAPLALGVGGGTYSDTPVSEASVDVTTLDKNDEGGR
ncbi:hypothetical protein KIPB_007207, partial [Kipferlia bialata]